MPETTQTGPPGPWYRVAYLARIFDLGERAVWQWVADGRLPSPRRMGRRWTRWPKDEIDALLAKWRGEPKGGAA